jgi:phosphoribosylglycinamide formyltransferase 1
MYKICVLASGGGGNLRAILEHSKFSGDYQVTYLVTNQTCGAISVAKEFGVPTRLLLDNSPKSYLDLLPKETDLLVLAGFMPIVPEKVCNAFIGRIINTHPSLLPKYGGKGMYGVKVQSAVLSAGETETGCTIHEVDSTVDGGKIIAQDRISIPEGIDAWSLGGLVFNLERNLLPKVISKFALGVL